MCELDKLALFPQQSLRVFGTIAFVVMFAGLSGKSGVGKTTLLKSLSGLTVPTEGQIRVGEAVSQASGGAANVAEKTGLVFQFPDRFIDQFNLKKLRACVRACVCMYIFMFQQIEEEENAL